MKTLLTDDDVIAKIQRESRDARERFGGEVVYDSRHAQVHLTLSGPGSYSIISNLLKRWRAKQPGNDPLSVYLYERFESMQRAVEILR